MIKRNLPVLLLSNVVLFPSTEARLEFDTLEEKQLLSLAEGYYDDQILVIHPKDPLEVYPVEEEFPSIGVVASIKMKMDMPNGKTRLTLNLLHRVKVHAYSKEEQLYEAMISDLTEEAISVKEETAYVRSIRKLLDSYIDESPHMSNSLLSQVSGVNQLDILTDIVVASLSLDYHRKLAYIQEKNPIERAKMILDDIHRDLEIMELEKRIDGRLAYELDKSQKEFVLREKIRLIKEELGDIRDRDSEVNHLREQARSLKCSEKVQNRLFEEINCYEATSPNSPELGIIRTYIDWLLSLPWQKTTKDVYNLDKVKKVLDSSHYGLDVVKDRILEYLAVKKNTHELKSPILCLVGPPGVGKTTLAKSIATALGRKTTKISVGGINDEAEIVGHRRTYIGAAPGLIIQGLKKAGVANPVFIIDEIDKMTKDIKGDPASALLEVLDPEQNRAFVDHYIEEEFDLSQVMFITTANYFEQIPNELRDRLEIIELSSYTEYEKLDIVLRHLLPRELKEHGLKEGKVEFEEGTILTIIREFTKESGVRDLERNIAAILRKIVKKMMTGEDREVFQITDYNLEKYLGKKKYSWNDNDIIGHIGVVNGLAYTPFGGDILPIEATCYPGQGNLSLTGSLGEVMKESALIALSYIKSHAKEFKISYERLEKNDIHIHVPEGATPKDGPSAGVALTTTLLSLFTETRIHTNVAMTGEMTLRGKVLPIGGVREKVIGAHRNGIRKVFLPRLNEKDLDEIPEEIRRDIQFIFVDRYLDIYQALFKLKRKSERQYDDGRFIQLPID